MYTGQPQRDAHLRSADFFDVEHHPTWAFVGSRIHQVSATEFEVTGDLTVRGVTRSVTFDVTYLGRWDTPWWEGGRNLRPRRRAGFTAAKRFNRQGFSVSWKDVADRGGVVVSPWSTPPPSSAAFQVMPYSFRLMGAEPSNPTRRFAVRVDRTALELDVDAERPGDVLDREVAGQSEVGAVELLHPGGDEGDVGEVRRVQEIVGTQVAVALLVALTRLLPGTARPAFRRMDKVTGRCDDMIILRGVNVFPTQIEEIVLRTPSPVTVDIVDPDTLERPVGTLRRLVDSREQ